jgi:hypothetical protein
VGVSVYAVLISSYHHLRIASGTGVWLEAFETVMKLKSELPAEPTSSFT